MPAVCGGANCPTADDGRFELPPAGPAWAGSLMGTAAAGSIVRMHGERLGGGVGQFMVGLSGVFGVAAVVIAAVVVIGWLRFHKPGFAVSSMAGWSMLGMGVILTGALTTTLTHNWVYHGAGWVVGTVICLAAFVRALPVLKSDMVFTTLLPIVCPIVPATAGAQWIGSGTLGSSAETVVWSVAALSFVASVLAAVPQFPRVYRRMARSGVPAQSAATAWVPLGIMGQSVAAAQLLAGRREWDTAALYFGAIMLAAAAPLALYALYTHWRAVPQWPTYNPTWWSATFPLATLSLGSHLLGQMHHAAWLDSVSAVLMVLLVINWTLAAAAAVVAAFSGRYAIKA